MNDIIVLFAIGIIIFLGHFLNKLFYRTKIPDLLILMLIGILFGPVLGYITVSDFGELGPVFASVALVIILFEGGLSLKIRMVKASFVRATLLTIVSFTAACLLTSAIVMGIFHLSLPESLLFGAMVGGISPAIVIPVAKYLNLTRSTLTLLVVESVLSDVFSIIIFTIVRHAYELGSIAPSDLISALVISFGIAGVAGLVPALFWIFFTRDFRISTTPFASIGLVFILYSIVEMSGYSGAFTAFVFGIALGNIGYFGSIWLKKDGTTIKTVKLTDFEELFFGEIVFIIKTFFFIYIGISMQFSDPWILVLGFAITLVLLVTRLGVAMITLSRTIPVRDAGVIAVTIPKGLAAAVLATIATGMAIPGFDPIIDLVYAVILFSIVIYAAMGILLSIPFVQARFSLLFRSFGSGIQEDDGYVFGNPGYLYTTDTAPLFDWLDSGREDR